MGLEIPDELKPVAALVVYKWPETDETGLRGAADQWDQMASLLEEVNGYGDDVVKVVLAHTEGETHDAIDAFWKKAGGDDGALTKLADFCKELAFALRVMAALVLAVKIFIIAMLVYLVIQLAAAAAAAIPTLGASAAEGAAVQVGVRATITQALKKLLENITKRTIIEGAAWGAGLGGGFELGFQSLEKILGLRDGYDWQDVASKTVFGGIKGAIAAPVQQMLINKGLKLPGDDASIPVPLVGNVGEKFGPTAQIAKMIGTDAANVLWGEEPGLVGRGTEVGEKYVRQEIVEELTELDLPKQ